MRHISGTQGMHASGRAWWQDAVLYRVDLRSFRDSDGDGIGDINGVRDRLGYLELLGIDAVWLNGLLAAPFSEAGSGCVVDTVLGDLDSVERLITEAHEHGIRVGTDFSVERSSVERPDFDGELEGAVRFWMDRGVDWFMVGASPGVTGPADETLNQVLGTLRCAVAEYTQRGIAAFVDDQLARIPGLGRLQLGLDVRFSSMRFNAEAIRSVIDDILSTFESVDTDPLWTLAGWSRPRPAGQYGRGRVGLARARAMALVQLGLPGTAGVDNGDELGLAESNDSGRIGGLPARGPMPWAGTGGTFGFTDAPYAPAISEAWQHLTVEDQLEDPESTFSLYREAIALRRTHRAFENTTVKWYGAPPGCLAFQRGNGGLTCALNTSQNPVTLPPGEVLLASNPTTGHQLPADTAVWLA